MIASLSFSIASSVIMAHAENYTPALTYYGCNVLQKGTFPFSMCEERTANIINNALYLCQSGTNGVIYFTRHWKNNTVCSDECPRQKYCRG
jgi:hypothetical protein